MLMFYQIKSAMRLKIYSGEYFHYFAIAVLCMLFVFQNLALSLPWDGNDISATPKTPESSKGLADDSLVRTLPLAPGRADKSASRDDGTDVTIDVMPSNIPSLEGKIGGWYLLKKNIHKRKVCYIVNYAASKVGTHTEKRKSYLMVSYISSQRREVSIVTGYNYRGNSIASVSIDGEQFSFVADKLHARPRAPQDNLKIISKMLDSSRLMMKAESYIGTYSIDTYKIDGFRDAYISMVRLCQ